MIVERVHLARTAGQMRPRMHQDTSPYLCSCSCVVVECTDMFLRPMFISYMYKRDTIPIDLVVCTYSWKCTDAYRSAFTFLKFEKKAPLLVSFYVYMCWRIVIVIHCIASRSLYIFTHQWKVWKTLLYVACLNRDGDIIIISFLEVNSSDKNSQEKIFNIIRKLNNTS